MNKPIKNKFDYPSAEWLDQPRLIGKIGPDSIYLLGYEYAESAKKKEEALVAVDYSGQDYLAPIELYSLLSRSQESININDSLLD